MRTIHTLLLFISLLAPLAGDPPPITLEHAWTPEQINWGLMQRTSLAENHGMLFHYGKPCNPTFWAFNCRIDLSVAFIDSQKVIRDIQPLYAAPEKMDPARPVDKLQDMSRYRPDDPAVKYFLDTSITCKAPIRYVLEMNLGWFERNGVDVGDQISWDVATHTAVFKKSP